MGTIALLLKLLPFITNITPVIVAALAAIRAQSNMTTAEIFAHAGSTLDANEKKLLEDLERLNPQP